MIALLTGTVAARHTASVVIDVNGVGYEVLVPTGFASPVGTSVTLHTHLHVREDAMTLYGFADRRSKQVFEMLLGSSGIGPKLALAALSALGADRLAAAVATSDIAVLTEVPGIGRKVAERLALELHDKIGTVAAAALPTDVPAMSAAATAIAEVEQALSGLGYQSREIDDALRDDDVRAAADTPTMLRAALRVLGTRS